jgi:hypothetical protein
LNFIALKGIYWTDRQPWAKNGGGPAPGIPPPFQPDHAIGFDATVEDNNMIRV